MRNHRRRANAHEVGHIDLSSFAHGLEGARKKARESRAMFLKHSGERLTDLLRLDDDELSEMYRAVRDSFEQRSKMEKERMERFIKAQKKARAGR